MSTLTNLLGEQWLIGAIQLLLAGLIKPQLRDKLLGAGMKATGFIPLFNVLIAYLGFQLLPASANAAGFVASIIPIREGISVLSLALLQTVMVTGTHSTFKNTLAPVGKIGLKWLFSKLAPVVERF